MCGNVRYTVEGEPVMKVGRLASWIDSAADKHCKGSLPLCRLPQNYRKYL